VEWCPKYCWRISKWKLAANVYHILPIYNGMVGADTPYSIEINGMVNIGSVDYDITVSLDADQSSANNKCISFLLRIIYIHIGAQ
jgi:hypothetical protein